MLPKLMNNVISLLRNTITIQLVDCVRLVYYICITLSVLMVGRIIEGKDILIVCS